MNLASVKSGLANFSPDPLPDLSVSPLVRFDALLSPYLISISVAGLRQWRREGKGKEQGIEGKEGSRRFL